MTTQVSYKPIQPLTISGGGYGNTYRFEVTVDGQTMLSTCERDVAEHFTRHGHPVPSDLAGPYDGYGRKLKTIWNYTELPKGFYSASISHYHGEKWMFRAIPNSGDHCCEGIFDNEAQARQAAEEFAADMRDTELAKRLYSAAY